MQILLFENACYASSPAACDSFYVFFLEQSLDIFNSFNISISQYLMIQSFFRLKFVKYLGLFIGVAYLLNTAFFLLYTHVRNNSLHEKNLHVFQDFHTLVDPDSLSFRPPHRLDDNNIDFYFQYNQENVLLLNDLFLQYNLQVENLYFTLANSLSDKENTPKKNFKNNFNKNIRDHLGLNLFQLRRLEDTLAKLRNYDQWEKLNKFVNKTIHKIQNPTSCNESMVLLCDPNKSCGFGCQIHHILHCFNMALAKGKVMLFPERPFRGFNSFYQVIQPISNTCKISALKRNRIERASIIESYHTDTFKPPAVPEQILKQIESFHSYPFYYWSGKMIEFLFNFQPSVSNFFKIYDNFTHPIVGYSNYKYSIHVRRTDKIGLEAAKWEIEEYMFWVDLYYQKLELNGSVYARQVYLATDEQSLINEARQKFPEYKFIYYEEFARVPMSGRTGRAGTLGILADIFLLSKTDYLVCTFSSQVCRLAFEWMNARTIDASFNFKSLDEIYYFGGQRQRKFNLLLSHTTEENVKLNTSAKVDLRFNFWNGYSQISVIENPPRTVDIPSYKIRESPVTYKFKAFEKGFRHDLKL